MTSIVLDIGLYSSLLLQFILTHQSLCWSSLCLQKRGHSNYLKEGAASSYFHHLFRWKDCGHPCRCIQKSIRPRLQDWVLVPSLSPTFSHFPFDTLISQLWSERQDFVLLHKVSGEPPCSSKQGCDGWICSRSC